MNSSTVETWIGIISVVFLAGIGFGTLSYTLKKVLKENQLILKKLNIMDLKIEKSSSNVSGELKPLILENRGILNKHEKRIRNVEKIIENTIK